MLAGSEEQLPQGKVELEDEPRALGSLRDCQCPGVYLFLSFQITGSQVIFLPPLPASGLCSDFLFTQNNFVYL